MRPQALAALREARTFGDDVEDDTIAFSTEFEAIAIGMYMNAMAGRLVSCPGVPDMFDHEYCEPHLIPRLFLSLEARSDASPSPPLRFRSSSSHRSPHPRYRWTLPLLLCPPSSHRCIGLHPPLELVGPRAWCGRSRWKAHPWEGGVCCWSSGT